MPGNYAEEITLHDTEHANELSNSRTDRARIQTSLSKSLKRFVQIKKKPHKQITNSFLLQWTSISFSCSQVTQPQGTNSSSSRSSSTESRTKAFSSHRKTETDRTVTGKWSLKGNDKNNFSFYCDSQVSICKYWL